MYADRIGFQISPKGWYVVPESVVLPRSLHLEFMARQPEILHDQACPSACVAKGLVVRAPGHGLRIVGGALGRTEPVVMQEIHLAVAWLDGGGRAVDEIHVVHLRTCIPLLGPESKGILYHARLGPPAIAARSPSSILFRIALRFQSCGVIHVMTAQRAEQRTNNDDDFYD